MASVLKRNPSASGTTVERVVATPAALEAILEVRKGHGSILFYQSGGCCDGSLPMCFAGGELILGDLDLLLGFVGDCPVYIDRRQYEVWKNSQLILDVADGEPEGFSLAAGRGRHFITRSRICSGDALSPPYGGPTVEDGT
jgi:uncharacterized protein